MQVLVTEMFKIHPGVSPEILRGTSSSYKLCRSDAFKKRQVLSVYHGTESLLFLYHKIWDLLPVELEQSKSLDSFKLK